MNTEEQLATSLKISQLLNPVRGEDESFEDFKKRRRNINKVAKLHIKGQALSKADVNFPMHAYHVPRLTDEGPAN